MSLTDQSIGLRERCAGGRPEVPLALAGGQRSKCHGRRHVGSCRILPRFLAAIEPDVRRIADHAGQTELQGAPTLSALSSPVDRHARRVRLEGENDWSTGAAGPSSSRGMNVWYEELGWREADSEIFGVWVAIGWGGHWTEARWRFGFRDCRRWSSGIWNGWRIHRSDSGVCRMDIHSQAFGRKQRYAGCLVRRTL